MGLKLKCPGCQSTLQVADSARGKQVKCSSCQTVLRVPAGTPNPQTAKVPTRKAPTPNAAGSAASSLQLRCPSCQTPLKVPSSFAGKVVRCSKCQTQLKVPGGGVPAASSPPAAPAGYTPPSQPSDDPFANLPTPGAPSGGGFGGGLGPSVPQRTLRSPNPVNPYSTPSPSAPRTYQGGNPSRAGRLRSGRSAVLYNIPAIIMMCWAALVIGVGIFQIGLVIFLLASGQVNFQQVDTAQLFGRLAGQFLAVALQGAVLAGGIAMVRRSNLGSAKTAAVITTIPCFGCLVFPIGIWACVLLFSNEAEQDFA
ncbi:30S ribosomal protein S27ae [Rhodopirellula sallentina]|uniref:Membrane protein containing putative Zinc finger/thioredoxin domain n=1 Tax=Rhodopirellula sallentina SM41 TaxID=1263870 RepID=M5U092_9BACT|nr:30S ribosomal protein S27ae [Rhodopirellula sallentina]EMI54887.1 membrane protein containing putative Zinc finger/thioredoxin domain [Rhodopirellula sallentina SM41]